MRPFSLLVKPASADCNLRCRYCFYLGKGQLYPETSRHRMPGEVLERMIQTFLATDQPVYGFGWQGGEPTLMGRAFFESITELQSRYGRPGSQVSNGLQTNTTLIDDALAQHLARYSFLVGVSIDGPAEVHDRYRTFANGQGSHAKVLQGLEALKRHRVEYNVLTLVSRSNVEQPRAIYRYLCDLGVLFHQYIECVEFDEHGALMPFAVDGPAWGEFLCGIFDAWYPSDTRRVSVRLFDTLLARMVDDVENTCVMNRDCRQYLVVEHNGDVYPCDFYVEPDLRLGNVMTDSWEAMLASPVYEAFGKRKSQWNPACDTCPYLDYCLGCCPKNRMTRSADPTPLSVLCDGWRLFYEHTLSRFETLADEVRAERRRASTSRAALDAARRNDPCPCGSGRKFKKCCGK